MWVGSRNCGCLVAWLCYQFMAKPGSRTAAVPSPGPYVFTVYMTHRLSVYILYWHTNAALILVTSYLHIHFSYVHECILTALYCAVFVLLMHVFLWLSLLLLLYIVRNDENKDDQSIDQVWAPSLKGFKGCLRSGLERLAKLWIWCYYHTLSTSEGLNLLYCQRISGAVRVITRSACLWSRCYSLIPSISVMLCQI